MTAALDPATRDDVPAADPLERAIEHARPHLRRDLPLCERLRAFWAAVAAAADLAEVNVMRDAFLALADEVGLTADLGRHAKDDLEHVVAWARRGRDPFGGVR